LKRALAIREKAIDLEHPYVATSLQNLARLYEGQGRYAEAEPLNNPTSSPIAPNISRVAGEHMVIMQPRTINSMVARRRAKFTPLLFSGHPSGCDLANGPLAAVITLSSLPGRGSPRPDR
jgi:hypothetical protein